MVLVYINPSLAVFLSIICLLATIGLGYLLFLLAKKERKKYLDEVANFIDGVETKNEIIAEVKTYISRRDIAEFTMLLIDFDNFKDLISNFGQIESDRVLKKLIEKIVKTLPLRMSIGRLRDDQFIVFDRGDYSREEMVRLSRTILDVVREPVGLFDEAEVKVTCSIGIAYYPAHGQTFKQLLGSLEIVTFVCKRNGGDQYRIYSPESNESESSNMEYYYQIKDGIKNKEFDMYYQPIIDGKTKDIYAIEGLLRWNHPTLGLLSPYKFINIMEQTGDIHWVGLWGFETVVKKHLELKKKFNREFKLSLNLSPKQLANESLPHDFQKILKKYRVQAVNFILEIEEFTIFEGLDVVQNNLSKLNRLGFSIAVDGMGLDYKGLKKLQNNAINVIKMDRDFLNEEDQNIKSKFIEILIDYAIKNRCVLISEGVEDYSYLARSKSLGIDVYQGYWFSKPISSDDIDDYITYRDYLDKLKDPDPIIEEVVSEELVEEKTVNDSLDDNLKIEENEPEVQEENQQETISTNDVIPEESNLANEVVKDEENIEISEDNNNLELEEKVEEVKEEVKKQKKESKKKASKKQEKEVEFTFDEKLQQALEEIELDTTPRNELTKSIGKNENNEETLESNENETKEEKESVVKTKRSSNKKK